MARRSRNKVAQMVEKAQRGEEPTWDPNSDEPVDLFVVRSLNYYNVCATASQEKTWTLNRLGKDHKVAQADASKFVRVGRYARILSQTGIPAKELSHIESMFNDGVSGILEDLSQPPQRVRRAQVKPEVLHAKEYASSVLQRIDTYTTTSTKKLEVPECPYEGIQKYIKQQLEVEYNDWKSSLEENAEFYEHISETRRKKVVEFLDEIIKGIASERTSAATQSPIRKPRKINPINMTKKVKFLGKYQEYTSTAPSKIVSASAVVIYDTKTRIAWLYEAEDADGMTVKGTTLLGWSEKTSHGKTIREIYHDGFLKAVTGNCGIRAVRARFKEIPAKPKTPKGRINSNCLIAKVIK